MRTTIPANLKVAAGAAAVLLATVGGAYAANSVASTDQPGSVSSPADPSVSVSPSADDQGDDSQGDEQGEASEAPETDATEAPESEAPESEAPESEAPETHAPETEAPDTEDADDQGADDQGEAPEARPTADPNGDGHPDNGHHYGQLRPHTNRGHHTVHPQSRDEHADDHGDSQDDQGDQGDGGQD